jgi:hypothetical protein
MNHFIILFLLLGSFTALVQGKERELNQSEKVLLQEYETFFTKIEIYMGEFRNSLQKIEKHFQTDLSSLKVEELFNFDKQLSEDYNRSHRIRNDLLNQLNKFKYDQQRKDIRKTLGIKQYQALWRLLNHSSYEKIMGQVTHRLQESKEQRDILARNTARASVNAFWAKIERMTKTTEFMELVSGLKKSYQQSYKKHALGVEYLAKTYQALHDLAALDRICLNFKKLEEENSIYWAGCNLIYASMKDATREIKFIEENTLRLFLKVLRAKIPEKLSEIEQIQELLNLKNFPQAIRRYDELLENIR